MASSVEADVHALVADLLPILVPGATLDADAGVVALPVPGGRARVSTDSLLAQCAGQPQHLWPRTVDGWLTALRTDIAEAMSGDDQVTPERLRVRVTPRGRERASELLVLPYGAHFDATVVVDYPTRIRTLTRAEAARLGLDPEQAIKLAIRQTVSRELAHLDVRDHDVAGTAVRMLARDGSAYVSAALLSVARFLPGGAPYGALVAVPHHGAVLLHAVTSAAALDFAPILADLVRAMYRDAADPCTDRLFWWVDGTLHAVTVEQTDDPSRPRVRLPAELADVVRRLPG